MPHKIGQIFSRAFEGFLRYFRIQNSKQCIWSQRAWEQEEFLSQLAMKPVRTRWGLNSASSWLVWLFVGKNGAFTYSSPGLLFFGPFVKTSLTFLAAGECSQGSLAFKYGIFNREAKSREEVILDHGHFANRENSTGLFFALGTGRAEVILAGLDAW